MMIIDIHTHPLFEESLSQAPADLIEKAEATSFNGWGRKMPLLSLADFEREMEAAGIDRVVFLMALFKGDPVRAENEELAGLIGQFPDKFIGFAGFDPNQDQAPAEIEFAVRELGFKGVKTIAATVELDINDPAYYPAYAKAQELGVPLLTHTGVGSLLLGYRAKHVSPLMIDDVALDFPDLKIICAHLGAENFMEVHALLRRHANVYADLSFWPLNPRYVDLIPWPLFEETVPDKLLLGSDYPCGQTPAEAVEAVRRLPVSDGFKAKILGQNAARLLGL
ncbi:MAG: amidohydrolase [Deltaproteobacteria bacterium]|nr:amidohydrolase [Deltaproteobacteria bacterium]